jgi:NADPH:quinone reductase-like Zn-dependent oxidoreductase
MELEFSKEFIDGYMNLPDSQAEEIEKVIQWIKAGNLKMKNGTKISFKKAVEIYNKQKGKEK